MPYDSVDTLRKSLLSSGVHVYVCTMAWRTFIAAIVVTVLLLLLLLTIVHRQWTTV
jgi:hypothetical protein